MAGERNVKMDVNQTSSIASVHQDAKKSPQHRDQDDQGANKDEHPPNQSGSWRDLDAVDVDINLSDGVSPEIQGIIDGLNQRIEPLRAELELAKGREAHFCELAARHSFLDVPCRREFMRELTHILTHIDHLTVPPAVIALHLIGTETVRMKAGRAALDHVLGEACGIFSDILHPSDILGNLSGNDFAVILLSEDGNFSTNVAAKLREGIAAHSFAWNDHSYRLDVASGTCLLSDGMSVETALDAADRGIRRSLDG
jgi:GGDEF domain-containing protein